MVPRPARRNHIQRRVHARRRPVSSLQLPKPLVLFAGVVTLLMVFVGVIAAGLFIGLPRLLASDVNQPQRVIVTAADPKLARNHVLLVVKTSSEKSAFYWLDGSKKIIIPGGYGEYELRAAVALLALENKDEHQFKTGLSHALSTIVTGVVPVNTWSPEVPEDIESQPLRDQTKQLSRYFYRQAIRVLPHDLPRARELFALHRFFDDYISLSATASVLEPAQLAETMKSHPLLSAQQTKACPIAIINTTDVPGMANHVSQLAEQSGGVVIRVEHEERDLGTSQFLLSAVRTKECEPLLNVLRDIFPGTADATMVDESVVREYRANLVLLLGDDLGEYYGK